MGKKIYKRHCDTCGEYYEGIGEFFCSRKCVRFTEKRKKEIGKRMKGHTHGFKKGAPSWNKGKTNTWMIGDKNPNKDGNHSRGKKNCNWKGNKVDYGNLHKWIRRCLGKPNECEHCGKTGEKEKGKWNISWANVDHTYKRNTKDWIALCPKCHGKYDKLHGFRLSRKNC